MAVGAGGKGVEKMINEMYVFHAGCNGCTQQVEKGVDHCVKCCYFDSDWHLLNLNNRPLDRVEIKRNELKAKYGLKP